MAKGDKCIISNCKNTISQGRKGKLCGTHRWRFKKYEQYDLPSHIGEPNLPVIEKLPTDMVSKCEVHGYLQKDQTYVRYYKGREGSYYCRECLLGLNIKNKYKGMNGLDDYNKLLLKQNGSCAICRGQNNTTRNGKIKRFNVDHCHKTDTVRGLLCSFCNSLLGYAKDSIKTLESAITYLKASQS
jgi:hypothetical protein